MPTMNRRQFIHSSAVGAAAAMSLSARPLRAEGANRTVTLAVMGVNNRGKALAAGFAQRAGCQIAYVCDVDSRAVEGTIAAVAEHQSKAPQGVKDFRKALDDKAVDALVIAAPDHWHAPATILACQAGKHVYVEKPASHNGHEAIRMVEVARRHDRRVQMGNQRRSAPKIREMIERVHQGEIGDVLFARGWINSTRPSIGHGKPADVPSWLDYQLWQGPAPETPYRDNMIHYHWHWFWNWGTGELGNNGVHFLDLCRWAMQVDWPTRVTCNGGKYSFQDDQQTPDTQIATFHFGDRAINWEHRTWHRRGFENQSNGITLYGKKGSIVYGQRGYVVYDMQGKKLDEVNANVGAVEHQENFLAAIRDGATLNSDIQDGAKSAVLCHLGNIAYRTGATVDFDPKSRRIINNNTATALWKREYRKGWEV